MTHYGWGEQDCRSAELEARQNLSMTRARELSRSTKSSNARDESGRVLNERSGRQNGRARTARFDRVPGILIPRRARLFSSLI
jgi:hypothetical protein